MSVIDAYIFFPKSISRETEKNYLREKYIPQKKEHSFPVEDEIILLYLSIENWFSPKLVV